ncbi:MAG: hypothetical protein NXH90_13410 [Flavobacteriaceae bacterium]|nr:hypothetical protein [Flavobacteriaceae bacterium]
MLNGSEDCVRLFREYHGGRSDRESWFLLANSDRRFLGLVQLSNYVDTPDALDVGGLLDTIQDHCASKLVFIQKGDFQDPVPSVPDIELYEHLKSTAELLRLDLMDFLLVSATSHCSFADLDLVPNLPFR